MTTDTASPPPTLEREVRLGLVMYGGVSLAIYINGVAHEFFRAVRGRGTYRLLKALIDSDIVVDVMSGASAGGINGIFLGYALCNEREFSSCGSLWRQHGDLGTLMRKPDAEPGTFESLLDSENVYQPKLHNAFDTMWTAPKRHEPEWPSPVSELDLFVVGTDYNGRISTHLDDAGQAIQVKNHRTVFWLKHRTGRKHQFDPRVDERGRLESLPPSNADISGRRANDAAIEVGHASLAKLARITSCFPAAFAPVRVTVPSATDVGHEAAVDRRLALWGDLRRETYFLDGGILDNKPFTGALNTIFYRLAARKVDRVLFYVEPDPERFQADAPPVHPTFVQSVLDSITTIPAYESIADDLRLISQHNSKIERFLRLSKQAKAAVGTAPAVGSPPDGIYLQARLDDLSEKVTNRLLDVDARAQLKEHERKALESLVAAFRARLASRPRADVLRMLDAFDVDFAARRALHLTYAVEARSLLDGINRLVELLEIVRHAIEQTLGGAAGSITDGDAAGRVWEEVDRRLSLLLDVTPRPGEAALLPWTQPQDRAVPLTPAALAQAADVLRTRASRLRQDPAHKGPADERVAGFRSILVELDEHLKALVAAAGMPEATRELEGFPALDAALFPIVFVSDLHERDLIRTVRISPLDAQRGLSRKRLEEKVCGVALAHFGAFLKQSWRSNDLMWGRLDGACQLVENLLTYARVSERRGRLSTLLGHLAPTDEALAALVPRHDPVLHERLLAWLRDLRAGQVDKSSFEDRVSDLIEAMQLEILHEELPIVLEDAIAEQIRWNQYRIPSEVREEKKRERLGFDATERVFLPGSADFDPLVVTVAAERLAREAFADIAKSDPPKGLGPFFRERYLVGTERVTRDIPRLVLLDLAANAMLIVRNCLVGAMGTKGDAVRSNAFYKLFLDWPLRLFRRLVHILRSSPRGTQIVVVGSVLYIALSAVVNIAWWKDVVWSTEGPRKLGFALFLVTPLVLGVLSGFLVQGARLLIVGLKLAAIGLGVGGGLVLLAGAAVGLVGGQRAAICGALPRIDPFAAFCTTAHPSKWGMVASALAFALPLVLGGVLGWRMRGPTTRTGELKAALRDETLFTDAELDRLSALVGQPRRRAWGPRWWRARSLIEKARASRRLDDLELHMRAMRPQAL